MSTINQKEYLRKYLAIGSDPGKKKKRKKKSTLSDRVTIIDDDIDETFNQAVEEDLQCLNEDAPQIVGVIDDRPLELRIDDYRKSDLWKPLGDNADNTEMNAQSMQSFKQVDYSGKTKKSKIKVENDDYSPARKRNNRSDDDYSPIRKSSKANYDDDVSPIRRRRKNSTPSPNRRNIDDDGSSIRRRRKNSTPSPNRRNTDYETSPIRRKKSSNTDFSPIRQNERYQSPNRKSAPDDVTPPRRTRRESDSNISRRSGNERDSSPNRSNRYPSLSRNRRDISPNNNSRNRERMHYKNSDMSSRDISPNRRKREQSPNRNRRNSSPNRSRSDLSPRSSRDISPNRRKRDQSPNRNRRNSSPHRSRFDLSPRSSKNTSNRSKRDISPNRSRWDSSPNKSKTRRELDSTRKSYQDGYRSPPRRSRRDSDSTPPRRFKYEKDPSPSRSSQSRRNKSPERLPKDSYKRRDSPKRTSDENRSTIRKSRWDVDSVTVTPVIPLIQIHKKSGLQRANELIQQNEFLRQNIEETASIAGNIAPIVRDRKTGKIRDFNLEAEEAAKKQEKEDELKAKYDKWGKGLKQVEDATEQFKAELHEMNKPLARYADDKDLEKHLKEMERDGDPMLQYLRKKRRKDEIDSGKALKPLFEGEFMPNRYGIRPGHRWDGVDRSSGYEKKWFEVMNSRRAQQEDAYKWSTEDM